MNTWIISPANYDQMEIWFSCKLFGYDPSLLINMHFDFGMHTQNMEPMEFRWFILYEHV